jgi:hypothetical protein
MRHVYYRQEYDGPQVERSARVVGTGIALHYAPDGSLRWVRGAQLPDVAQSDPSTTEWRQLPFLALDAAFDLFHDVDPGDPCALAVQHSVLSAFKAVGYGFPEPPFSEDPPYRCDYEE